jgi:hypothetical protein
MLTANPAAAAAPASHIPRACRAARERVRQNGEHSEEEQNDVRQHESRFHEQRVVDEQQQQRAERCRAPAAAELAQQQVDEWNEQ